MSLCVEVKSWENWVSDAQCACKYAIYIAQKGWQDREIITVSQLWVDIGWLRALESDYSLNRVLSPWLVSRAAFGKVRSGSSPRGELGQSTSCNYRSVDSLSLSRVFFHFWWVFCDILLHVFWIPLRTSSMEGMREAASLEKIRSPLQIISKAPLYKREEINIFPRKKMPITAVTLFSLIVRYH